MNSMGSLSPCLEISPASRLRLPFPTRCHLARFRIAMALRHAAFIVAILLPASAGSQQKNDSTEARRRASGAQARFESVRRQNLPLTYSGTRGECDARIGRFCQWNSDDDTVEAKQPRAIRRARERLLASLDSAAKRSPNDGWIAGQRVRYFIEAKNDTAAVRAARECRAAEWWCSALEGLALHVNSRGAEADSAFARALRSMPASERCRWTDMSSILDDQARRRFGKVGCGRSETIAEKLWWISDPFWSIEGNERRAEHYARHTMARTLASSRNAYGLSWSNDMREAIVRYGWPRYWSRGPGTSFEPQNGPVTGHEATPNYHFVPVSLSFDSIPQISYDLDLKTSAERYASVTAKRVVELDPQIAVFRRGDSALVVAAYDVSEKRELDSTDISAALVIARDEFSPLHQSSTVGRRGALSVLVETQPQLVSVEVINAASGSGAAWKRSVLRLGPIPGGAVSMSDPLLFDATDEDVTDLDAAMRSAIGGNTVSRGKVGIYWEMYGLARTDSAEPVSLTLTRVQQGTLRRIGESIGLATRSGPLTIRWNQTMSAGSVTSRSVILDLSLIPRGKYMLRIETDSVVASRTIEVR
jgi:hypothetical protein